MPACCQNGLDFLQSSSPDVVARLDLATSRDQLTDGGGIAPVEPFQGLTGPHVQATRAMSGELVVERLLNQDVREGVRVIRRALSLLQQPNPKRRIQVLQQLRFLEAATLLQ